MAENLTGFNRTCYCGEVTEKMAGAEAGVCGWVQRQRDLGGLIFIDLRDREGVVQLAVDEKTAPEAFKKAFAVRAEFVLAARGKVRMRSAPNKNIKTGLVEIAVEELRVLAPSETPPFEISENSDVREELRLKYRFLDLRRPDMQKNIIARHKIVKKARDYFDDNGFLEIETPMLIKSTPEGARDYLVPSRVKPGSFYALPQSPQLYKQLLMLSGFDRYMQVARCFRDEDLRADRQPEFTQIDIEMSFVREDDVMAVNEGFIKSVFGELLGVEVKTPFERIPYADAMARYGSDKPDLRFALEFTDITEFARACGFKAFSAAAQAGGNVSGFKIPGGAERLSRKEIDRLAETAKTNGAGGLAWTKLAAAGSSSSFEKFLTPEETKTLHEAFGAAQGDLLFVIADADRSTALTALGAVRLAVAEKLGLRKNGDFRFAWVTEFPMFEYSKEENRYVAMHHPFTAPMDEDLPLLVSDKGRCRAKAYDMVLNGVELGGGSIRINDRGIQQTVFKALGFSAEEAERKFGFLLNAFKYGAPPHGGMAYGLDRLVMLMLGLPSIRDTIAFPKVQNASELMTGCPSEVDEAQLNELSLNIPNNEAAHQK